MIADATPGAILVCMAAAVMAVLVWYTICEKIRARRRRGTKTITMANTFDHFDEGQIIRTHTGEQLRITKVVSRSVIEVEPVRRPWWRRWFSRTTAASSP